MTIQLYIFTCKLITSSNQSPLVRKEIWLRIDLCGLKPSLSMKILSIIDFTTKLVSIEDPYRKITKKFTKNLKVK